MLSQEMGMQPLEGLCVYDALIVTQMIDKLLRGGLVTGREVTHVAGIRTKMVNAAQRAGVDIEKLNAGES